MNRPRLSLHPHYSCFLIGQSTGISVVWAVVLPPPLLRLSPLPSPMVKVLPSGQNAIAKTSTFGSGRVLRWSCWSSVFLILRQAGYYNLKNSFFVLRPHTSDPPVLYAPD